jgi:hypothetical protein
MTTAAQTEPLARRQAPRLAGRRKVRAGRGGRRAGFSSVASLMITIIGIATLLLVVNWTYLNFASRRTQDLAETLAWSAVSSLLDDERLEDAPAYDQTDEIDELDGPGTGAILTPTTGLLDQNNDAAGPTMQVQMTDLALAFGRIEDANSPVSGGNSFATPAAGDPYNTLRVEIYRDPGGANPVQLLIRGMGSPDAAKISGAAYATLDSRVIGFRPGSVTSPVAPLAVEASAWFTARPAGMVDSNANDRYELDVVLKSTSGGGAANSALVNVMEGAAYDSTILADQIENGIEDGDVLAGMLGPATVGDPTPLSASEDTPAGDMDDIRDAFNAVAASNNPRRVFPIYSGVFADPLDIVGFIGARVLGAVVEDAGSGDRLRVVIEPDFIVHPTVVTALEDSTAATVPENIYIHKIRLTR